MKPTKVWICKKWPCTNKECVPLDLKKPMDGICSVWKSVTIAPTPYFAALRGVATAGRKVTEYVCGDESEWDVMKGDLVALRKATTRLEKEEKKQ